MKKILIATAAMLCVAAAAFAQVPTPGMGAINLSWVDCGLAGTDNEAFACNTNAGTHKIFGSFAPGEVLPEFTSTFSWVDLTSLTPTLPDYWKHGFDPNTSAPNCRVTGTTRHMLVAFNDPGSCSDPYSGSGSGDYRYDVAFGGPNKARILVSGSTPVVGPMPGSADPTEEQTAFRLGISNAKTILAGTTQPCAGCDVPMCIVLRFIRTEQTSGQNYDPTQENVKDRNFITWQSNPVGFCPQTTPVRNSTWGKVKQLYR